MVVSLTDVLHEDFSLLGGYNVTDDVDLNHFIESEFKKHKPIK